MRSAVDHFARQVAGFVRERGLLPNLGYRVCTLHSLAHDIVRSGPAWSAFRGLASSMTVRPIASSAMSLAADCAPSLLVDEWLAPDLGERDRERVLREKWPLTMLDVGTAVTKRAKDLQLSPADLSERLHASDRALPFSRRASRSTPTITSALAYRGAVDFDDLIRLALDALQLDADLLARLRHRWPYVLEDEAQDSGRLQESILRLLTGPDGNWVRVGDPIRPSTRPSPRRSPLPAGVPGRAGRAAAGTAQLRRSTLSVIALANRLMEWTRDKHRWRPCRDALAPPRIEPTPPEMPSPTRPTRSDRIHLSCREQTAEEEVIGLVRSLAALPRGAAERQRRRVGAAQRSRSGCCRPAARGRAAVLELLRSTDHPAARRRTVLAYLDDPLACAAGRRLHRVAPAHRRRRRRGPRPTCACCEAPAGRRTSSRPAPMPRRCLYRPVTRSGGDELALPRFLSVARRWLDAALLPVDQLASPSPRISSTSPPTWPSPTSWPSISAVPPRPTPPGGYRNCSSS